MVERAGDFLLVEFLVEQSVLSSGTMSADPRGAL
jgi:hypothetical protein